MNGFEGRRTLTALLALAAATLLPAQTPLAREISVADKVAWLKNNAVAIRTIDPHDKDFADLRPLQQAIGAARVVLLGGTVQASIFGGLVQPSIGNAKFRLVRFLHEEMGFDVLASPLNPLDANEADREFDRSAHLNLLGFAGARGFHLGMESGRELVSLLDYARDTHKTVHPLHLAGLEFDAMFYRTDRYRQLIQFIDRVDPLLASPADRKAIRALITLNNLEFGRFPPKPEDWQKVLPPGVAALARLDDALGRLFAGGSGTPEVLLYRQAVAYIAWTSSLHVGLPPPPQDLLGVMAKSIHPTSKIVVWADNASVQRSWHARELGTAAYSIAFTGTRVPGEVLEVLVAGPPPHLAPADDHLESLIHGAGKPYVFVDLRGLPPDHWLQCPVTARFLDTRTAILPQDYDAFIGIDLTLLKPRK